MAEVNASIITIGDELLIGQTIDTNSAFIGQELNKIGIWIKKRIAVGDVKQDILDTLKQCSIESNLIIITGGLGPTSDDITKPVLCNYFGSKMIINEKALQNVKDIFTKMNRPLIQRNLTQAEVPDNCIVLQNDRGTAPGMWFEKDGVIYISLPGVPNEMKGLMQRRVIPELLKKIQLPAVVHKTLLTSGVGESTIADRILDFEKQLPSYIKLAYLPSYGLVRLRLTGRSDDQHQLDKEMTIWFDSMQQLVKEWMVASEDITLQEAVIRLLRKKKGTLSTAESCTGGFISHLITSVAGSSHVFNGSVVAYANTVKEKMLDVEQDTLEKYGAVSEQTITQMVQGSLRKFQTTYAIATSGIMGPDGGSESKPVGTVWVAVGHKNKVTALKYHFRFDRARNIELTAHSALTLLYRFIEEEDVAV